MDCPREEMLIWMVAHIYSILVLMPSHATRSSARRRPTQRRARHTVDAILDAVVRVLKREGFAAITTNRVAEVAGVSIGSVYQYFPNKSAIFVALHNRHIQEVDHLIESALVEHAGSSLEELVRALFGAMIEAHSTDPELFDLLLSEVPHRADGTRDFAGRLHGAFLLAISSRAHELKKRRDLDKITFVVTHMVEALSHGAILRRPSYLSLADATEESIRAVMAYLRL
jgi:AcrR family transcriptional regulator